MRSLLICCLPALAAAVLIQSTQGADWTQFRGPNGSGISTDPLPPLEWDDSTNVAWKTALPGPGSSSPIILGQRIFLTCYSGYGLQRDAPGEIERLQRHVLCIDREDGKIIWEKTLPARLPDDPFSGIGVVEHGYASNTPVTDGQRLYVFLGKSGVFAFDMDGKQLWQTDVGQESSQRRWGSAASLVLYEDKLIVNASEESQSLLALDRATGQEIWKAEAGGLELAYGTPLLVEPPGGEPELVLGVPLEVWGFNPNTGKLKWFAENELSGNISPSPIAGDGAVYVFGGYPSIGAVAVRPGGKGDVTESHVVWSSRISSYVPSPVFHDGFLYWVSDQGIAHCSDAASGESIYRERLPRMGSAGRGKPFYASVVNIGDRLYAVSRKGWTYVIQAKPEYKLLAQNQLADDGTDFNGTPAVSNGQLFVRSNRFLYRISSE